MNDSGTPVVSDTFAHLDIETSSSRFEAIPIWNVDHVRLQPLVTVDHYNRTSAFLGRAKNRRSIIHQPSHNLAMNGSNYSFEMLPPAAIMINLPENRHSGMLSPCAVLVNHNHNRENSSTDRITNHGPNVLIDYFGGGDSSEAIIEYYRGRLLHAITAGRQLMHSGVNQFVHTE